MNNKIAKVLGLIPDSLYLRMRYFMHTKKLLSLRNPKRFNEKLQWLKLYNRKPEYTRMVDKYEAKLYVSDLIGEEYIIPTLGVWDDPDEIDFDALPERFALKCTHNSGKGMYICKDKSKMNKEAVKEGLRSGLKQNYYLFNREWPYKNVKPRIIAEQYIEECSGADLIDYKFYCFNGEPRFLYVSQGLAHDETACINYVTLEWEKAEFKRNDYQEFKTLPPKPQNFDKMIELSKRLSDNVPFLRVDFYNINGKIYFSELTFSPGAGFTKFDPPEWDEKIGEWIRLH